MGILWIVFINAMFASTLFGSEASNQEPSNNVVNRGAVMCDSSSKYRTMDGTCNNLVHRRWGSSRSCYRRLLPAFYEGESDFRLSVCGGALPSAADLAVSVHRDMDPQHDPTTTIPVFYGQFLAHDISSAASECKDAESCPPNSAAVLYVPDIYDHKLTPFIRSSSCPCPHKRKRDQLNKQTSFIDGSLIYGNSEEVCKRLRTNDGTGRMKLERTNAGYFAPRSFARDKYCLPSYKSCFEGADVRINQHSMLAMVHTLFLREHNRIAEKLKNLNCLWDDEKLFQESRRIVGAELQAITYNEYLPLVLGEDAMTRRKLRIGDFTSYRPDIDPTALNEHVSAVARIGHSRLWANDSSCLVSSSFRGAQEVSHLEPCLLKEGFSESLLDFLMTGASERCDESSLVESRTYAPKMPGIPHLHNMGIIDITRGRDHGMPPYVEVLRFCFGDHGNVRKFSDLKRFMTPEKIKVLKKIYKDVHDIDLWVGLMSERVPNGQALDPTSECIQEILFWSLKYGDRFYFEHQGEAGSFTKEQVGELRKVTLAKVFCDNTDFKQMLTFPMQSESDKNSVKNCIDIPEMDISVWKDS